MRRISEFSQPLMEKFVLQRMFKLTSPTHAPLQYFGHARATPVHLKITLISTLFPALTVLHCSVEVGPVRRLEHCAQSNMFFPSFTGSAKKTSDLSGLAQGTQCYCYLKCELGLKRLISVVPLVAIGGFPWPQLRSQ